MKTLRLWAVAPMAALVLSAAASAQTCGSACGAGCGNGCGAYGAGGPRQYSLSDSYHDNRIWPRQYVAPSRRGICQAFELQAANGWRLHNLLGKYHFDQQGIELSEAGKLKVQWILTQAPQHRRTIFVERGVDVSQTAERISSVQELASNVAAGPVDVQETLLHDEGRPAATVDAMFTGFRANSLPPVLPPSSGGSGSDSSGQ
jgi:hypothetical protein